MKEFFALRSIMFSFIMVFGMNGFAQVAGDFQTKTSTGNWSDFNAWNIYNGGIWIAATPGQVPIATANVFVQTAQVISVDDAFAVCNNLNITNTAGGKVAFTIATGILNVKGNLTIAGTANCFGTWIPGAKIIFSGGGSENLPDNLGTNSVLDQVEVNKSAGTLTSGNSLKFNSFTLTAGNFNVADGAEIRGNSLAATININGGTWTQIMGTTRIYNDALGNTFPIGAVIINSGMMVLATSTSVGGFQFSKIDVVNGGSLILNNFPGNIAIGTSINVDGTSTFNTSLTILTLPPVVTFNGIVNYDNNIAGGAQIVNAVSYSYLRLSGIGIKTLEAGITTIPANGTLEMSGVATSPTLVAGGTLNISSAGTNLLYSSAGPQTATTTEWNDNFQNITINNTAGVNMGGLTRTISGSLTLTNGTLNIGAGGNLILDGASLNRTNGFIDGANTSDLSVTGTTGGLILLPLSGNTSMRNITISGSRMLSMNGSDNIDLSGLFYIGPAATYDNNGESQITQGGSGSIVIDGKFINRDKDNFTGASGAIPGIIPALSTGCIIEYGLAGDQAVTARSDYQNITFSGSGTKTPSSTFTPAGTLTITGSAILDATNNNIGDGTAGTTNLTMDGGELILGTTGTQPMMNGTYNITGGVIQFASMGVTTQAIRSPETYYAIEVTGINVGNSIGNINLAPDGSFIVKAGGTFTINADQVTGSTGAQTVTVEAGGQFQCGNTDGFSGGDGTVGNSTSVKSDIENIFLMPGSTVNYMRAGIQTITNQLAYQNLTISGTGNKTAPPGILTVEENLISPGTGFFSHNGGTVLLDGPAAQNFAGLTYNNLILSNGTKTTSGNSIIIDSIKINTGATLSITSSDTITLHSDATRTARVAKIDGIINYNITGRFVAERYISAKRAWRFLSVPINSVQTIKQAWQEGALNSGSDPNPGFGTQITSDRSTWLADGFDVFSAGGSSMKTYNPVADNYTGISTTNTAFVSNLGGYMTFIRGNRTAATFGSPPSLTVLRLAGNLFEGSQPDINVVSGEIIPINNPYASALDLRKISASFNVSYYVWDPNRGGAYGLGAFQTLLWSGTDYDVIPGNSGSYGSINNFIESGQAFFAATLGADTALQLNEDAKSSAAFAILPLRPAGSSNPKLHSNLYSVNADGSTFLADGALTIFGDAYSNEVDGMDAKKLTNFGENLSIKTGNKLLAAERKHTITTQDTVFLDLSGVKFQQYHFEFITEKFNQAGLMAFLEDNYTHTKTPLNPDANTIVGFTVTNDPGAYARDRFRVVFVPAREVPVTFSSVKAFRRNRNILVQWKAEDEINIKQYEVDKSINGMQFKTLAIVAAGANNRNSGIYLSADTMPAEGYNYYRVKSIDKNNRTQYSDVVKVLMSQPERDITIFPNPVINGIARLQFNNQPAGEYGIQLINKSGQVILFKKIKHVGGSSTVLLKCGYNLSHGVYRLEVTRPGGSKININVLY